MRFTKKQGQYLAFIYHYSKIYRCPLVEADIERYFGVSPPTVHQTILVLHNAGLISRTPGAPRTIRVLVPVECLPYLQ